MILLLFYIFHVHFKLRIRFSRKCYIWTYNLCALYSRCMSHISAFMHDHLHWLPPIAQIQLKVLTLIYSLHIGQAPRYLHVRDLIRLPSSAISLRLLRSLDRHDLFVPRAKTSMAQTRAIAIIDPSLWNQLLPSTRSILLIGEPTSAKCLFSFSHYCSLLSGSLELEALRFACT